MFESHREHVSRSLRAKRTNHTGYYEQKKRRLLRLYIPLALLSVFFGCHGRGSLILSDPELKWVRANRGLPEDGMWKTTPVLTNVNSDGLLDLAALPRIQTGARVWLGNGKGSWRDASDGLRLPLSCGGGVAFGDFNKDGATDLAVADHCAGVFVYLGDGQGHWKMTTER